MRYGEMCSGRNLLRTLPQKNHCPAALQVLVSALAAAELVLTTTKVLVCGGHLSGPSDEDRCPDFRTPLRGGYWPPTNAPYFTNTGLDNATCWLDAEGAHGQWQSVWLVLLAGQGCREDSLGNLLPFLLLTCDILYSLYVRKRFSALHLLASSAMFCVNPSVCSILHLAWNGDQKLYLYIQVPVCLFRVLLWLNFDISFSRQEDTSDLHPEHGQPAVVCLSPPAHGREGPGLTGHFIEDSMQQLNIGADEQRNAKMSWLKRVEEMELLSLPCDPLLLPSPASTQQSPLCQSHGRSPAPHSSSPFSMILQKGELNGYHRKHLVWPSRLRLRRNSLSTATAALSLSNQTNVLSDCKHHMITS